MLEKGKYVGRIVDFGIFRSRQGRQLRTAYVDFEVFAQHDPVTGELDEIPPVTRTYYKAITDETIAWVIGDLRAIGYDRQGFRDFDPEAPGAPDLFGREIDVVCEHDNYRGTEREKWSISPPARRRLDPDELAELDVEFAHAFRRASPDGRPAAAPAVVPNDDDEAF
jgi:hypothetical protein